MTIFAAPRRTRPTPDIGNLHGTVPWVNDYPAELPETNYVPVSLFVDSLLEHAALGRTIELTQSVSGAVLVHVNGRICELPARTEGWEVACHLMYRCGMDSSAVAIRQNGLTHSESGSRVICVNRPFDGRLLLQLVAD